ncbi:caspase family protein [Oscillatoria amoena NRMC-F 0135]|nr:caspase family protein [Oscillatoria amoena NRMC-F 0135]
MRLLMTLILTGFWFLSTAQERRIALIIGNSDYHAKATLKNPVNDARSMDETLKSLGFVTLRYENLGLNELKKAIDEFGKRLSDYEIGLFYYAGHGIQYKGRNYLIPIDADLRIAQQVEFDCVPADRVLAYMENSNTQVNLLILDACRNNPFESSWNRSVSGDGLAFMNAPSGSLIAYATAPGSVASDGYAGNGLYTSSLLQHIVTPNVTVEQVFKRVRAEIEAKTNKQQTPWESTSLKGDFYFNHDSTLVTSASTEIAGDKAAMRDLGHKRRHAFRIQAEVPVQIGFGYEFQATRNISLALQGGWLGQPNSLMMLNMMGSMGNEKLEVMIKSAFQSGKVYEGGINYHVGNNYFGMFGQSIQLSGAVATALIETNFDIDVSALPVKPGRTVVEPESIGIASSLIQAGVLYGRILPLKNPDWQVRLEFAISKNFASSTQLSSADRDLSSFEAQADAQLDSWFSKYAYVPSLTIGITRTLGSIIK